MNEVTPADFRQYFGPVFEDKTVFTDAQIGQFLTDSAIEVSEPIFRKYYKKALYYLTAHYLTLNQRLVVQAQSTYSGDPNIGSVVGVISSVSVGDLSLSKELPTYEKSSDDKYLASTSFGQEFIRLRNKMTRGPLLSYR